MVDLKAFVEAAQPLRLNNIVVLQHGHEIACHHWEAEIRRNAYSASKSFTAVAVGLAVQEGLLALEDRVLDHFAQEAPQNPSDYLRELTVEQLLTMSVGHDRGYLMAEERYNLPERDWVRYALALPIVNRPGSVFMYDNTGPYLAGVLVQRLAGCDLVEYLMPRLFEPMGIWRPTWETDPLGRTFGAGGLMLRVSELARFGQLLLQKGLWEGRELVPAAWVEAASARHIATGAKGHGEGYGYLFWLGKDGAFRADGKYGQYAIVCPEKDAVVAVMAECPDQGKIMPCIWEHIYPQL